MNIDAPPLDLVQRGVTRSPPFAAVKANVEAGWYEYHVFRHTYLHDVNVGKVFIRLETDGSVIPMLKPKDSSARGNVVIYQGRWISL